jgi:hypothetical protein
MSGEMKINLVSFRINLMKKMGYPIKKEMYFEEDVKN